MDRAHAWRARRWAGRVVACLWLVGCGEVNRPAPLAPAPEDAGARGSRPPDQDRDGLCDFTEFDYGTDPADPDTDGDGLPDFVEVANAFDAVSTTSPAEDQVGMLEARRGATLELPVRATVNAAGEVLSGFFAPITTFFYEPAGALDDFFLRAVAVSADPEDNVRRID